MFDREFPEQKYSIYSKREKVNIPTSLIELYHGLTWQPVATNLFLTDFVSWFDYDNSLKILDFNKNLSSLLGIVS
jgi:hypothetical protein